MTAGQVSIRLGAVEEKEASLSCTTCSPPQRAGLRLFATCPPPSILAENWRHSTADESTPCSTPQLINARPRVRNGWEGRCGIGVALSDVLGGKIRRSGANVEKQAKHAQPLPDGWHTEDMPRIDGKLRPAPRFALQIQSTLRPSCIPNPSCTFPISPHPFSLLHSPR